MRWWLPKKFRVKSIDKIEKNGIKQATSSLRESEQKLKDAIKDSEEVRRVSKKSRELARDHFSEALERAMRRTHG